MRGSGPANGKAVIATRIKLGDTQKIVAIAETSKGEFWQRQRRRDRHARGLRRGPDLMANVLINAPKTAKKGEVIEIKTLISHPMETGFRPGTNGRIIPRNIIEQFTAS